jgi:hypothetical protein
MKRTNHTLPLDTNPITHQSDDLKSFANDHQMVINEDNTKVMLFSQGVKRIKTAYLGSFTDGFRSSENFANQQNFHIEDTHFENRIKSSFLAFSE